MSSTTGEQPVTPTPEPAAPAPGLELMDLEIGDADEAPELGPGGLGTVEEQGAPAGTPEP